MINRTVSHVHMIGIGGAGMCGLAEILVAEGFDVAGTDAQESAALQRLRKLGVRADVGHDAARLGDAQVVIYSSAIPVSNPERQEAERRGIPTIARGEMLAELMRLKYGIAIGGSHGKTTTTTMMGGIMRAAHLDPTVIIGGKVVGAGTGVIAGESEYLLTESDESDGSFLLLRPIHSLITNIDAEHLTHYGTYENLLHAFVDFANSVPFWGSAVVCYDSAQVRELLPQFHRRTITYGFVEGADVRCELIETNAEGSRATLFRDGIALGEIQVRQPGRHNVLNATGAATLAMELGIEFEQIAEGLSSVAGIERRMEVKHDGDVRVIDDYAHHPTEISATLRAIRTHWGTPLKVLFQPHRYTRTEDLWDDFCGCFDDADELVVTDIYAASEAAIEGISGVSLTEAIREAGHRNVTYLPRKQMVPETLLENYEEGVVVTLGAGDISKVSEELSGWLEK